MSEEEPVTREKGFIVAWEPARGAVIFERVGDAFKDVAHWVIDRLEYYISNETMREAEEIIMTRGVVSIELEAKEGGTLTIVYSVPDAPGESKP